MERLLNTTTGRITWVHVISALGYTAGSMLCGVVFDRVIWELQLACSCFLSGVAGALAPFTGNLYGYIILCGIQSVADAYINTGTSIQEPSNVDFDTNDIMNDSCYQVQIHTPCVYGTSTV